MVCVHCGGKTAVVNSRRQQRSNQIWRRRQCQACGAVFTTLETPDHGAVWLVKGAAGAARPFSRDKLFLSLHRSLQHRPTALGDAGGLTETVIKRLRPQTRQGALDHQIISQTALVALNRFDKAASVHYQAYHKV